MAQWAAFDGVAFGFPLLDFLVGEHGAEVGRPPDRGVSDEGQADIVDLVAGPALGFEVANRLGLVFHLAEIRAVKLEENPLRPADVFGIGGGDFAVPIVAEAERFQLAAKRLDIRGGGDRRMLAGLDRVLLGGQAERVIAHRMQDVEAVHPLVAADDVGGGVAFRMADVQARAAGVGEHVEHVEFRLRGVEIRIARTGGAEGFLGLPALLPLGLEIAEREWFAGVGHGRERAGNVADLVHNEKKNPEPQPCSPEGIPLKFHHSAMNENPRDDHKAESEGPANRPDHLRTAPAVIRNGVLLLPSRGEKVTVSQVREILEDDGI